MINVVLLGSGNVAVHLAKAFVHAKDINFIQRYSRSKHNEEFFDKTVPATHKISEIKSADIYIIAVSDDAISDFSKHLKLYKGLVVHTSGSVPLSTLQCKANKGVFYPLQSFSIEQKVNIENVPFALETEDPKDFDLLLKFAKSISKNVYKINSSQREKLHIAAVFANNFTNQMFKLANDICKENNFSFDLLKPLINETAAKIQSLDPAKAQTGPAKRNDQKIIEKHLSQLSGEQKEIYKLISKSIIDTFKN
jgi:predicted short-subunit dehydrogenase-like oxidoreductase (DUF2520 family)